MDDSRCCAVFDFNPTLFFSGNLKSGRGGYCAIIYFFAIVINRIEHQVKLKRSFIVGIFLVVFGLVHGKTVPGFVIDVDGNRIEGEMKITAFCGSDAFRFNSFEQVSLHAAIKFRAQGKRRFKEYFPETINGFAFMFKQQWVVYTSTLAPYHYFGKIKSQPVFLRVIEIGQIKLFDRRRSYKLGSEEIVVADYYVADEADNLYRISGNDVKNLHAFLIAKLQMRDAFFDDIDYKVEIRNLKWIVMDYNDWIMLYSQVVKDI